MKYLVTYEVDNILQESDGTIVNRSHGHTLTVSDDTKIQAFINAYNNLTNKGHMVKTKGAKPNVFRDEDGVIVFDHIMAGLSSKDMEEIYKAGIPKISQDDYGRPAMTHIKLIRLIDAGTINRTLDAQSKSDHYNDFVDGLRLGQLNQIESQKYDLNRLIRLCEEINICYSEQCFLAVAMLTRAIIDHVPPIFGYETFAQVVNNYPGSKSFKESMQHLDISSRKIADAHLHTRIRKKEILPSRIQVNFANDMDVLLAEIIRILE